MTEVADSKTRYRLIFPQHREMVIGRATDHFRIWQRDVNIEPSHKQISSRLSLSFPVLFRWPGAVIPAGGANGRRLGQRTPYFPGR